MDGYDNHTIAKPTYFKPNDVTAIFQGIVDTYGVPSYLEANPALVSTVTFPFLFGMMFGDMGHGSILLAIALIMVFGNDRLKDTLIAPALRLRYIFLFMGICATYCGFIYNEFFAMQTNIFASCYDLTKRAQTDPELVEDGDGVLKLADDRPYIYTRRSHDCNYPMGADPVWGLAANRLTFVNGIKMKLSVIFGVFHMTMGIVTKGTNCVYFRDWPSLVTEVIAGLIILLGLFGWMDLLIIAKWFCSLDIDSKTPHVGEMETIKTDSEIPEDNLRAVPEGEWKNRRMPSVINLMIDTVFNMGTAKHPEFEAYIGKDLP